MNPTPSTVQSADPREAVRRIEEWLLDSGIQIDEGAEQGGVAGWLDRDGRPEFVYLEIAGYYLTAMAWLSSGAAGSPEHADTARLRARRAADWITRFLDNHALPTRLYLSDQRADWRNSGLFSFDLAMAARGLAATSHAVGHGDERREALASLCAMIDRISSGADVMLSHELVAGNAATMPDRWSTRSGPHHLKAAAAVLRLPERPAGPALTGVAYRTCEYWASSLPDGPWPCQELHPLLYALEGILICEGPTGGDGLGAAERLFTRLMELQASDGTLPETIHGGIVRSDVLAQALRAGLLLRARQYLPGKAWTDRLDRLADALLEFVKPDGGVLFARNQTISNTWCAMFAHQALYLHARAAASEPVPDAAFELLV
jgi:hypothetical protein